MSHDGRGTQRTNALWGTSGTAGTPGTQETHRWFDDEAGPVVRPYAMTRGRTTSPGQHRLDLIAVVIAETQVPGDHDADRTLSPEHVDIVELCRDTPQSVAELAAELDLPIGVVRVLIGDLVDDELVHVTRPVPPAELPDESILRDVISGLRAL
ncbi:DUF742 domain-containing protein [Streptomyces alfalfae]|uniref:DUF742 domain-containing protein n=1 Tax=Streptomyces alfalfae TaxID=1642299 RepID=A0A4Q2GDC5_9ACTN|nr:MULTISPECIES: DUF742 domain-containing protein [Streptomyces]AYA19802.1 DUF742 domain-containing protein [Streptomyces fradiae]QQC88213.1 DUF742 domain-containing protein [Streptomyces alfalfae]QUI30604.1 DUF742 domain-containing protein [Streptomyces alfalfae]RXX40664.1 DUF742 domain-containing protein [Streptomyces alfalfae]RZM84111.1 DUF742 domain-containing protein [Streptomyces alfalfae]